MDGDARIMDNIGGIRSESETRSYLERNLMHWDEFGYGLWILRHRSNEQLAGRVALRRMPLGGNEENVLGYALMPEFWGKGLATEVVGSILDIAFDRLQMHDAVAGALPENTASRRVMEKNGGVYERDTFYKRADHVLYRFRPASRGTQAAAQSIPSPG